MTSSLTFEQLRREFPVADGQPLPVSSARRLGKKIAHYRIGKHVWWAREAVEEYKRKRTVEL